MSEAAVGGIAGGVRVPYDALPSALHAWIDDVLGSPVTTATTQPGGFSPGVAARLRCEDGRRAFVKAVSAEANPHSPGMHRREARITTALPVEAPVPQLLASYDDGTWVALLLQDIEGRHPHLPWREDELDRVLGALDDLADLATPCPVAWLENASDELVGLFDNWQLIDADTAASDPWVGRHLDALVTLEEQWRAAISGDTLLHVDVRADNMLVDDERVWLLDWPSAARGNPVFDLVSFAPSVGMQGGPQPEELLAMSRRGRAADPDAVTALVAAVTGYFFRRASLPPPPGLPTVRAFQAAQGDVALRWLQQRTGWR
jgi:hypothetical protein